MRDYINLPENFHAIVLSKNVHRKSKMYLNLKLFWDNEGILFCDREVPAMYVLYKWFFTMMQTAGESSSFKRGKKRRNELIIYDVLHSV